MRQAAVTFAIAGYGALCWVLAYWAAKELHDWFKGKGRHRER